MRWILFISELRVLRALASNEVKSVSLSTLTFLHSTRDKISETHGIPKIRWNITKENCLHIKFRTVHSLRHIKAKRTPTLSYTTRKREPCLHACTPNEVIDYMFQNIYSCLCGTSYLGWISNIEASWRRIQMVCRCTNTHARTQSCSTDIQFYLVPTETDILRRQARQSLPWICNAVRASPWILEAPCPMTSLCVRLLLFNLAE